MFDGMGNSFHLGAYWCCAILASAALVSFADFTVTDSNNLSTLLSSSESIDGTVGDIYWLLDSDSAYIHDISSTLDSFQGDFSTYSSSVTTILNRLDATLSGVRDLSASASYGPRISIVDKQANEFLHDISNSFNRFSRFTTNSLDGIESQLVDINQSINNLTNFLNGVSVSGGGVLNTNLFALLMPAFYSGIENDFREYLEMAFYYLYGRIPSPEENENLLILYENFGYGQSFLQNLYSRIGYPVPEGFLSYDGDVSFNDLYTELMYYLQSPLLSTGVGDLYYAEYGTYDIENTTIGISNEVVRLNETLLGLTNGLTSLPYQDIAYDRNGSVNVQQTGYNIIESMVGGHFTDKPSTNIATVATNEIVNIADSPYQNILNRLNLDRIMDTTDVGGFSDLVDGINQQVASNIPDFGDTSEYEVDLGRISIFDSDLDVAFVIPSPPNSFFAVQRACFGILKLIVLFACVNSIYGFVTRETQV